MHFRWLVKLSPEQESQESEKSGDDNSRPPAPAEVDAQDDEWRNRAADGGSAVEESSGESALLLGKPFRYSFGCSWPVRGFTCSEKESEEPEADKTVCKRRENRNDRIPRNGETQSAASADFVHQSAERSLSDGIGDAKRDHDRSVVGVSPVILTLQVRCEQRERLAIEVIDDRRRKQNAGDPPSKVRNRVACGCGGSRIRHERTSTLTLPYAKWDRLHLSLGR